MSVSFASTLPASDSSMIMSLPGLPSSGHLGLQPCRATWRGKSSPLLGRVRRAILVLSCLANSYTIFWRLLTKVVKNHCKPNCKNLQLSSVCLPNRLSCQSRDCQDVHSFFRPRTMHASTVSSGLNKGVIQPSLGVHKASKAAEAILPREIPSRFYLWAPAT